MIIKVQESPRYGLSKRFLIALKLSSLREYRVAQLAGIHPSTLSQLLNGITPAKPNDPRIVAVGRVLGLTPDECFSRDEP
jgi:hypothetical protein